jgi:hypothetical protein
VVIIGTGDKKSVLFMLLAIITLDKTTIVIMLLVLL